jgi:L-arabinokinase
VFYVSGHGFGHASRTIEVINALTARRPDLHIVVRTTAPQWLFDRTVNPGGDHLEYHQVETDTGIAQIDSLHLDVGLSVQRAREFMRTLADRIDAEVAFLRREEARLVVADIPALGIGAGAAAGVPTVALGNFTWDWIYAAYAGTNDVAASIADAYAHADVALRLPMHGGFAPFSRIIDLPFIARRSMRDARDTRAALGLPLEDRLALVSFGGHGLERLDFEALTRLHGHVVLVSGRVPSPRLRRGNLFYVDETAMYDAGLRYEDLVRAADAVVTKPGYGIIAECLANDTALLYTSRGHFIEYDVLVAEMPRFLRTGYIDHADLFAGHWAPHLDALLARPAPPESAPVNGAAVAADVLLEML